MITGDHKLSNLYRTETVCPNEGCSEIIFDIFGSRFFVSYFIYSYDWKENLFLYIFLLIRTIILLGTKQSNVLEVGVNSVTSRETGRMRESPRRTTLGEILDSDIEFKKGINLNIV